MFGHHAPRPNATREFHEEFCAARNRRYILVAAVLASAMGFIDGSVVSIAIPAIRESLGASLTDAQWISNAYLLTLSALILVGGAFGDRFGLSRVFGWGIAVFVVASVVCALAPTANFLIAARAVQGVGVAFMVPGSLAIISRAYPREERGRAIGIWAASSAVTMALGPVIGGLALTLGGHEMWRWIFAVNLPFGLVTLWLVFTRVTGDRTMAGRGIDLGGALLATAALGVIAWSLTGVQGAAGAVLVWVAAGAAILIGFLLWEWRSDHPMLPLVLFANRGFSAANLSTFFLYLALSAVLFFLPMTVITGWGITELEVTAAFVPLTIFIAAMSSRAGQMADKYGSGTMIGAGSAVVAIAYAALALVVPYQNFWVHVVPAMALMGFGMGLVVSPLSVAVMGAAPDAQSGAASGVNNAVARLAGLVAVAGLGSVAAVAYASGGGTLSFGAASQAAGHTAAMNGAFATVAWITAALSALAAALAWFGIPRPVPQSSA